MLTLCTPNIASQEDLSFAADDLAKLTLKKIDREGKHLYQSILFYKKGFKLHFYTTRKIFKFFICTNMLNHVNTDIY